MTYNYEVKLALAKRTSQLMENGQDAIIQMGSQWYKVLQIKKHSLPHTWYQPLLDIC